MLKFTFFTQIQSYFHFLFNIFSPLAFSLEFILPSRTALQNAASIAGLLITTECLVANIPEKAGMPAMPPGGMGDMGGMGF